MTSAENISPFFGRVTSQNEAVVALWWTNDLMFLLIYLNHICLDCSVLFAVGRHRPTQLQHTTTERCVGEARSKPHYTVIIEGQNGRVTSRDAAERRPHVSCDSQLCCLLTRRRFSPRLTGYFCVLLLCWGEREWVVRWWCSGRRSAEHQQLWVLHLLQKINVRCGGGVCVLLQICYITSVCECVSVCVYVCVWW